jgi:hypothetical protein
MSQENADGKTPQKQTQGAWFRFWRITAIVFVLHLIPVSFGLWSVMTVQESVLLWLLFFAIDFPLGFLFIPVDFLLFEHFSVRSVIVPDHILRFSFFPAVFFQIVGTINWVIIILFLRWLARLLFGRCFRAI